jgi:hypothetical protein
MTWLVWSIFILAAGAAEILLAMAAGRWLKSRGDCHPPVSACGGAPIVTGSLDLSIPDPEQALAAIAADGGPEAEPFPVNCPPVAAASSLKPQTGTIAQRLRHQHLYVVPEEFLFDVLSIGARGIVLCDTKAELSMRPSPSKQAFYDRQVLVTTGMILNCSQEAKAILGYDHSPEIQTRWHARAAMQSGVGG